MWPFKAVDELMRMGNLMFISTIFASGLYASIYLLPSITSDGAHAGQPVSRPITMIQTTQADIALTSGERATSLLAPFPTAAQFETGDTWVSGGRRYRLYGIQSCLRGTRVTVANGMARDCGELNIIMTQAIIRDTRPVCETVNDIDQHNAVVVCQTTAGEHRYDLATYLIAQGWGFAAFDDSGQLVVPGYRVAEDSARSARAGLWASSDLPHPVSVLRQQRDGQR